MPKILLLVLAAAGILAVGGCTGDPNTPSIFWSETKAKERLKERQLALERAEGQGAELLAKRQKLQSQISAKQRQLDSLNKNISSKKSNSASSGEVSQAEAAEISRLEQEKDQLIQEIYQLNQVADTLAGL